MFSQELAQKIKGYQEQIASLNSKCKMLTMKAKHATMLLTVTEVEGLSEGMEELDSDLLPAHPTHPSVVMVSNALVLYSLSELFPLALLQHPCAANCHSSRLPFEMAVVWQDKQVAASLYCILLYMGSQDLLIKAEVI